MNYIVLDLEWNTALARHLYVERPFRLTGEIIQIGAARLDNLTDINVVDTYNALVKPVFYTKMHKEVTELTGITDEMINAGRPFEEVCEEFLKWCGDDYAFITWSGNDIYMLEDNMEIHGMDKSVLPACFDAQVQFDDQITHENRDFALSYAIWKLDLMKSMVESHDALNDVMNTVEVMRHIDMTDGLEYCEVGVWEEASDEDI
ncbi:MAG: exonuclease domain-containing protein [Clostridiales bacterium]|nr:exonuclease domain-containing protein [Candidatus Crickella caballi]